MRSVIAAGVCLPLRSNHATKVTFHKDPAKLEGAELLLTLHRFRLKRLSGVAKRVRASVL